RRVGLAFALVVLVLTVAGAAASFVLTRSSSRPEGASAGTPVAAAVKPSVKHHQAVRKTTPHVVKAKALRTVPRQKPRVHRIVRHRPATTRPVHQAPVTTTARAQTTPVSKPAQKPA